MAQQRYSIEVEKAKQGSDGKPSMGPIYRGLFAKDGFPAPKPGLDSCWDVFCISVENCPEIPMLGRREIVNGKPDKYKWQTYNEIYDLVMKLGNSIHSCGHGEVLGL